MRITNYTLPLIMIKCLLITILIEVFISIFIGVRKKKDLVNIVLANIITNPLVVSLSFWVNIYYGLDMKKIVIYFLEAFAFITEGILYFKYLEYKKINPFMLSVILNCFSYFIGELYNKIFY